MPVYEYECSTCHVRFDRKQRFDDEPIAICPQCQNKARRILHSVPIFFRGSGFYSTDCGRQGRVSSSKKKEEKPGEKEGTSEGATAKD